MIRSAISPKKKMHRCRVCKEPFVKARSIQPACAKYECMVAYADQVAAKAQAARVKAMRKRDAERKEAVKTRSDYLKEAQAAFNAYIRARDADKPCICCGKPLRGHNSLNGHNVDAGHYRSVGSAPHLRFDERNCHAQLVQCNRYGAGRAVDYRIGLIVRIGPEAVAELEADNSVKKWTIDELKAIKAHYKSKLKELLAGRSSC